MFFVFLTVCYVSAVSRSSALRCYNYDTDGEGVPQSIHAITCHPIISSCAITTTILHGEITRRHYHCSIGVNCHTVAEQRNVSYIHVQNCCHGDLCNDGINTQPVFESGKNYCYSASCSGENCLSKLLTVTDHNKLGTFCSQDGEQCLTQTRKLINTDGTQTIGHGFEMRSYEYWTGCATQEHPCIPSMSHDMTVTCCAEHLCNGENYIGGQNKPQTNQCYDVICAGDGCLLEEIESKRYRLCAQSNFGCEVACADNIYTVGCSSSPCVQGYNRTQDKTVIGCCSGDRCLGYSSGDCRFPKFHHPGPSNGAACLTNSAPLIILSAISSLIMLSYKLSHSMTKPTKWPLLPTKTQISLGIRPVWSVFAVHMKET